MKATFDRNHWLPSQAVIVIVGMADGSPLLGPIRYTGYPSINHLDGITILPNDYYILPAKDDTIPTRCGKTSTNEYSFSINEKELIEQNLQLALLRAYGVKLVFNKHFGSNQQRCHMYVIDNPERGQKDGMYRKVDVYFLVKGGAQPAKITTAKDKVWLERIMNCIK